MEFREQQREEATPERIHGVNSDLINLSEIIVVLFGVLILALSVWGIGAPSRLMQFVHKVMERDAGIHAAILVRVILGLALLVAATDSRFPVTFRVFGWVAIIAAAGIAVIGKARLRGFVARFYRLNPGFVRAWLLVGIVFGGFLVYGSVG
jgi:hypothetical protein